jgi:ribonucleoside-diphosphate reductase alpha chain
VEFADRSMEAVCYQAFWASTELAEERGRYSSYRGSLWSRGILPQDTLELLRTERGGQVEVDMSASQDWDALRARIKKHGMRNSNCVAIAPTATIANIIGVSASIEPTYQNLYVKSNLSGEFTVVNDYLVRDLKQLGLWDEVMISDLKYFDGNLHRPRAAGVAHLVRDRVRSRTQVADRSRRAAPEMDRPVAVAQHLYGGRVRPQAR